MGLHQTKEGDREWEWRGQGLREGEGVREAMGRGGGRGVEAIGWKRRGVEKRGIRLVIEERGGQ